MKVSFVRRERPSAECESLRFQILVPMRRPEWKGVFGPDRRLIREETTGETVQVFALAGWGTTSTSAEMRMRDYCREHGLHVPDAPKSQPGTA